MTDTRALREEERKAMERAWTTSNPEHQHNAKANFLAGFTAGLRYRDGAEPSDEEVEAAARAMWERRRQTPPAGRPLWDDRSRSASQDAYRIMARAALEAAHKASP